MREYNLQLQGLTKAQIDKSNQPLPKEVIESNWAGFSALLQGKVLQPTTTDSANARTTRRRSKRAAPTLAGALLDEGRASNATKVKLPQSKPQKTKQRKASTAERASRRIAGEPVEYGIFANPSAARPVPKSLQHNPLTRKQNSTDPRNHASSKKSISVKTAKP